jgi:tetratricopeptide (TPR) repeat protein
MRLRSFGLGLLVFAIPLGLRAQDPPEYKLAVDLIQQERWAAALDQIHQLEKLYPDNPKAGNLEGLALVGSGDTEGAAAAFERVLAVRPSFFPALKNLAVLEWTSNKPRAATHTQEALKLNAQDPILNSYAAISALEKKDTTAANWHLDLAGDAISAMPAEIEMHLAYLLGNGGLYPRAVLVYQDLVRRGGNGPTLCYNLGLAQYLAGDYEGSVRTLEDFGSRQPTSDGLNLLAQAYEKTNQTQRAVDRLREAIALDPADEMNYLDLAAICIDHNAYPLGITIVEVGLKNKPDSERLLFQLGLLHALSEQFDLARAEFERAAKLAPVSDLPLAAVELANIQQNRLGDAIQDLRKKAKQKSDGAMLWYLLGKALMLNGAQPGSADSAEAISAFEKAIRFDPRLAYPYVELGKIYMQLGRTQDAVPLFEKAVILAPQRQSSYYQLALAYRKLDRPERASQMLERLKELNRHDREFQQSGLVER